MNFYDTLALYMAIMSIYGTIKLFQSVKDRVIPQRSPQTETKTVKPTLQTQKPQSPAVIKQKVDKRHKYSVNEEACRAYLASRK